MKSKILYIWQLGVNVIGLPVFIEVKQSKQNFVLVGKGRNKDVLVTKNIINYESQNL